MGAREGSAKWYVDIDGISVSGHGSLLCTLLPN
jgi:hypothetical protein